MHKIRKVLLPEGGEPLAFRTTFIPRRLAPSLLEADLSRPMHAILEGLYGFELREADETIEYIVADGFRSEILHLPEGHPLVLVERITYLNSGEAVDCSRAYYRADRFRFSRRLKRSGADGADASATTMQALPREDGAMGLAAAGIAA